MEHNTADEDIQRRLAKRLGAPRGTENGNYSDGNYTAAAKAERKWLRELLRMFAKTGERGMTECSTPIVEATDTMKAEATEEMTISDEPATHTEVSAQSTVIQMPEQTAPKRRAPRVKFQRINADLARVYPPDGDAKLWWSSSRTPSEPPPATSSTPASFNFRPLPACPEVDFPRPRSTRHWP